MRKSGRGPGLTAFYKNMLDTSSADNDQAVASTSTTQNSSNGQSMLVKPPTQQYEPEAEYDPFLARQEEANNNQQPSDEILKKKKIIGPDGIEVEVNDEGEIIDKRDLLKAGLNITKKLKPELPNSLLSGQRGKMLDKPFESKAVGSAASFEERKRRERERLAIQMKEEQERKKEEAERKMKEEEEAARKRREGDDGLAEKRRLEAKERFLARKRAKVEEKVEEDE